MCIYSIRVTMVNFKMKLSIVEKKMDHRIIFTRRISGLENTACITVSSKKM
jgi:hypothetical protein